MATLYEFYTQRGQTLPSVTQRAQIYQQMGLGSASEYVGSADQNNRLLASLQGTGSPATIQQPSTPPNTQINTPAPSGGGQPGEAELIQAMMAKGHSEATARAAIQGRGIPELAKEYGVNISTPTETGVPGFSTQPSIDLPGLYQSLYQSSGVSDLEKQLTDAQNALTAAKSNVNENPFLSEATRVGKTAKLEEFANEKITNLQNQISTKKADIETQLNLQTKQFDINSQQAQTSLNQLNTLLGLGTLDNASGEDIANLARSTGLPTSMIQSAIDTAKSQQTSPQIISYDDGTNQGFVTVDKNTGNIINKQVIGASSGGGTATEREQTRIQDSFIQDVKNGMTLKDAISLYGDSLSLSDITKLYNQYSIYGPAKESGQQIQQYYLQSKKAPAQPQEGDISSDGSQIYLNGQWQPL